LEYKFGSETKVKQVKRQINRDLSTVKEEDGAEEQETNIRELSSFPLTVRDETEDDFGEILPEDSLEAAEEETVTEKPEVKKLRVEDVKTAKELKDVIPFSSSHLLKDIARNPSVVRVIFFLAEHGCSNYVEIREATDISEASLWFTFNKLKRINFPVVKINKHEQLNKKMTYFDLERSEQLTKDLKELRVWYEYFALKAFMKALPEFMWVELEKLRHDYVFMNLVRKYGFDFDGAIQLLSKYGVIYAKGQGEHFVKIKKTFDNYGVRVTEADARELLIGS